MKQKSSLRGSVTSRQSKTMGSTFTKQNKHEEKGQSSQVMIIQILFRIADFLLYLLAVDIKH